MFDGVQERYFPPFHQYRRMVRVNIIKGITGKRKIFVNGRFLSFPVIQYTWSDIEMPLILKCNFRKTFPRIPSPTNENFVFYFRESSTSLLHDQRKTRLRLLNSTISNIFRICKRFHQSYYHCHWIPNYKRNSMLICHCCIKDWIARLLFGSQRWPTHQTFVSCMFIC